MFIYNFCLIFLKEFFILLTLILKFAWEATIDNSVQNRKYIYGKLSEVFHQLQSQVLSEVSLSKGDKFFKYSFLRESDIDGVVHTIFPG